jgi:hypothetical protein
MRTTYLLILAAGSLLAPAAAIAETPTTTRIETRPFYGATVTLEEGVRVFRPLPPHDRIIINPAGRTPLNLSYEEHRSVSHNYHYGAGYAPEGSASYAGASAFGGGKPVRRHGPSGHLGVRGPAGGHGPGGHR